MNDKPLHYDGSLQSTPSDETLVNETIEMTDAMRKIIAANPYVVPAQE